MKKLIGEYFLGIENVRVYVDHDSNDGAAQMPGNWHHQGKVLVGFLTVGLSDGYENAVDNLLHEAMEYAMVRNQVRFGADLRNHAGPSVGLFVFDHDMFCELTSMVGPFMARVLPALHKECQRKK